MNLFIRELRANRNALIIWSVCMALLVISGMSKYTAYSAGGANSQIFNDLPYSIKALLGIGSFDVTTMGGYFAMLFLYIELAAAIHAVLLGSGILSKEERDKTTEFLIVKPVSRTSIITSKLLAALVNVLVLNIVTLVFSLTAVPAFNKGRDISGEIVVFMASMLLVQLVFFSLGFALAAVIRRSKAAGSISIGVLLGSFLLSKVTDLTNKLDALNLLAPFKYFSYRDIVDGRGLPVGIAFLSVLLAAAFVACAYVFYKKRDLSI